MSKSQEKKKPKTRSQSQNEAKDPKKKVNKKARIVQSVSSHRYLKFSDKIMCDGYMKTFIIAGATEERCVCVYCKDKDGQPLEIFVDNVETHILSKKHEKATPMG